VLTLKSCVAEGVMEVPAMSSSISSIMALIRFHGVDKLAWAPEI
jgi:hypothetical protein